MSATDKVISLTQLYSISSYIFLSIFFHKIAFYNQLQFYNPNADTLRHHSTISANKRWFSRIFFSTTNLYNLIKFSVFIHAVSKFTKKIVYIKLFFSLGDAMKRIFFILQNNKITAVEAKIFKNRLFFCSFFS